MPQACWEMLMHQNFKHFINMKQLTHKLIIG